MWTTHFRKSENPKKNQEEEGGGRAYSRIRIVKIVRKKCKNCQQLGWHKLWEADKRLVRTNCTYEDQEVSQGVLSSSETLLTEATHRRREAVLTPQVNSKCIFTDLSQNCKCVISRDNFLGQQFGRANFYTFCNYGCRIDMSIKVLEWEIPPLRKQFP